MSMTKRWIDDRRELADRGDETEQTELAALGLWQSPADAAAEEEAFQNSEMRRESADDLRHAEFAREIEEHWFDFNADETGAETEDF